VKLGVLKRLKRTFKPVKTKFMSWFDEAEIIKNLSGNGNKGYLSGSVAYNQLGLTLQISNELVIVGPKSNRKVKVGNLSIKYKKREVTFKGNFNSKNIKYLQILDAIRDIKRIPGTSINSAIASLLKIVKNLEEQEQRKIATISLDYKPSVRALLGAILEEIGVVGAETVNTIKKTLNPLTSYKFNLDSALLPKMNHWRIK
jgi:hypothetical protein